MFLREFLAQGALGLVCTCGECSCVFVFTWFVTQKKFQFEQSLCTVRVHLSKRCSPFKRSCELCNADLVTFVLPAYLCYPRISFVLPSASLLHLCIGPKVNVRATLIALGVPKKGLSCNSSVRLFGGYLSYALAKTPVARVKLSTESVSRIVIDCQWSVNQLQHQLSSTSGTAPSLRLHSAAAVVFRASKLCFVWLVDRV